MNARINLKAMLGLIALGIGGSAHAACNSDRKIQIADMSFASATIVAHIEEYILKRGFGCNVELVPGDTVPTATTMATKGVPDIGPELWMTNIGPILEEGVKSGNLLIAGDVISSGGVEGWWIPKYLSEKYPDLKSVQDMPKYAHLFADPANPQKGRFYNCPPGWGCEIVNKNLFKAYGMGESYDLVSPGSGAALDATIASAYSRKKPWIGYYWAPTAVMAKYDMVQLKMNPYDPERDPCNTKAECKNPHAGAFANVRVVTGVAKKLKDSEPQVYEFLSKISMDLETYNRLLSWSDSKKAEPQETATYFIKNFPNVWKKWVPGDVASNLSRTVE